jgi:hypothetical protein
MQKVFGILIIVVLVWAGIEYYTKGEAAFGGIFASGEAVAQRDVPLPGERAALRLRGEANDRFDRMEHTISDP